VVEVEPSGIRWVKSSASNSGSDTCVEVAFVRDVILMRDSKDRSGLRLSFSAAPWAAFVASLRPPSAFS
jgi:hypothetical protein